MNERPPRPARAEPREIVELRQLATAHPELSAAIAMQIELVDAQRRVQARVPLPWIQPDPTWLANQQRAGLPAVRFGDIPLEWSDFRLALRQTADILLRHEVLERADHERILALSRDGNTIQPLVTAWYERTSHTGDARTDAAPSPAPDEALEQVMLLSLRPFLARCAESLMPRPEFVDWRHPKCAVCGWEPDFAIITPGADRRLVCGRCLAQWTFDPLACPYCGNDQRTRITSFATRDGRYRVYGCDVCKRYLKAYDSRNAPRPALVAVDSIATLTLDAAAIQRGYTS